ncbi:MAG: aminoglycoside phosphotransferase [Alphaproteobacteria bacterium]|nr:aminoglycoside phosphotransferase [Alphaproteobacteria bacterium]
MDEPLCHNPSNPVTAGIWRVPHGSGTAIRKVISGTRPATHPDWSASHDPRSWLYWRREADFYRSDVPARLASAGLGTPALLDWREQGDGSIALLLEDVPGRTGAALSRADLVAAAYALGRAQAASGDVLERPWTSRSALRDHCASKHVDAGLLRDPDAWAHPLVRETWPEGLQDGLVALHDRRETLFALAEAVPRVFSHLDFWSHNLVVAPGRVVAIDWAFAGDGALGEDLANLVTEAVLDLFVDCDALDALDASLAEAYLRGLRDGGLDADPELVRLGRTAAAVKWHWLGALHLERAHTGQHHLYGGAVDPDPRRQYAQRGAALAWLAGRAEAAIALGERLGLT